jgi:hypothetical protein
MQLSPGNVENPGRGAADDTRPRLKRALRPGQHRHLAGSRQPGRRARSSTPAKKGGFRPDVEGMRGLAVALGALPRWRPVAVGRLRRRRCLLRPVGISHHRTVGRRTPTQRKRVVAYHQCPPWRENVLERLSKVENLEAVYLVRAAQAANWVVAPDGEFYKRADVGPVWRGALDSVLTRLLEESPRVVLPRDVP